MLYVCIDFYSSIIKDIAKLRNLYATVDDVDLLVAALLEKPCSEGMVGPTARCIISDVFYRTRYGDRFFHDVENQPGSFTQGVLDRSNHYVVTYYFVSEKEILIVNLFTFYRQAS